MATTLTVPSIMCQGCADTITEALKTVDPNAAVDIDVDRKTVTVKSDITEASMRQAITAVDHEVT